MVGKKMALKSPNSRQAAYMARNRAAIITAAQEVLADIGPQATVEQLADHAQISTTTFYKYFDSKEILFAEAVDEIHTRWIVWAYNGMLPGQSIENTLDTGRKLFWVKQTHPLYAKILHNTLSNPSFLINAVRVAAESIFRSYAERGVLENKDFEKRFILWSYSYVGILTSVHVTDELSPTEADAAFGIALRIWGLSESKINKLISRQLDFAPTK